MADALQKALPTRHCLCVAQSPAGDPTRLHKAATGAISSQLLHGMLLKMSCSAGFTAPAQVMVVA